MLSNLLGRFQDRTEVLLRLHLYLNKYKVRRYFEIPQLRGKTRGSIDRANSLRIPSLRKQPQLRRATLLNAASYYLDRDESRVCVRRERVSLLFTSFFRRLDGGGHRVCNDRWADTRGSSVSERARDVAHVRARVHAPAYVNRHVTLDSCTESRWNMTPPPAAPCRECTVDEDWESFCSSLPLFFASSLVILVLSFPATPSSPPRAANECLNRPPPARGICFQGNARLYGLLVFPLSCFC